MQQSATVAVNILVNVHSGNAAKAFAASMAGVANQAKQTAQSVQKSFNDSLSNSFFANLGANITTALLGQLRRIPGELQQIWNQAVAISTERANALKGLTAVAEFKGIDGNAARQAVQNLRLVKAGVVDLSSASTALKNLTLTGFGLDQSIKLLERFSDSAAFGKQAALSYSQAIERASEGIRLGLSSLSDAAGVPENLDAMLKRYGSSLQELQDPLTQARAAQALFKGMMEATAPFVGNADQLVRGYSGTVAASEQAHRNFLAAIGDIITDSPAWLALLQTITGAYDTQTNALKDLESQQHKTVDSGVAGFSELALEAGILAAKIAASFTEAYKITSWFLRSVSEGFSLMATVVQDVINTAILYPLNKVFEGLNQVGELTRGMSVEMQTAMFGAPGSIILSNLGGFKPFEMFDTGATRSAIEEQMNQTNMLFDSIDKTFQNVVQETDKMRESFKRLREENEKNRLERRERARLRGIADAENIDTARPRPTEPGGAADAAKKGGRGRTETLGNLNELRVTATTGRAGFELGSRIDAAVLKYARQYDLDPNILLELLRQESINFSPSVLSGRQKSTAGAIGIAQFMPATARNRGVNPLDIFGERGAIAGAAAYIRDNLNLFNGRYDLALAGYNAGENRTSLRAGRIPNIAETQNYVKTILAKAGGAVGRKGVTYGRGDFMTNEEQSRMLTQAGELERVNRIVEISLSRGIVPNAEQAEQIARQYNRIREKQGLEQTFTAENVRRGFAANVDDVNARTGRGGLVTTTGDIGRSVINRQTVDEEFLSKQREALGIGEKITENVFKRQNILEYTSNVVLADIVTQSGELIDVEVERGRLAKLAADTIFQEGQRRLAIGKEANDLQREFNDLQVEFDTLGANRELRARNELLRERNELERDRMRIEDEIANFGVNSPERIRNAILEERLDLLRQEEQAVIDIGRAQIQLAEQGVYSANRANASVAEYLAQQKGITESIADLKVGVVESTFDYIDSGLEKILGKSRGLLGVFRDFAAQLIKIQLNKVFQALFLGGGQTGVQTGQQTQSGGGFSWGNILRGLGIGGGSGGVQTTPPFNPNAGFNPFANFAPNFGGGGAGGSISGASTGSGGGGLPFSNLGGAFLQNNPLLQQAPTGSGAGSGSGGNGGVLNQYGGLIGAGLLFAGGALGGFGSPLGGALSGAGLGAQIGSIIPGVGTLIGGAIGGIAGFFAGLFGSNSKKKKERKQLNEVFGDAKTKIQKILEDYRANWFRIDGANALSSAESIRDQFADSIKQLSSGTVKREAQAKLAEINSMIEELRALVNQRERDKAIAQRVDEAIVPTYQHGGFAGSALSNALDYGGGMFTGYGGGSSLAMVHKREVILAESQIAALGGYSRMKEIGVRGISMSAGAGSGGETWRPGGGAARGSAKAGTPIFPIIVASEDAARAWAQKLGGRGIAQIVQAAVHTGDDAGLTDTIERRLAGELS